MGVWTWRETRGARDAVDVAQRLEAWGYSTRWVPEAVGRDPCTLLAHIAANTERLQLATGIASIYARDAMTMNASQQTLAELSGGRFLLGLGVSHAPMVTGVRGHDYGKPVTTMRNYLDTMEKATYLGPRSKDAPPIVLAALRPRMLALAAERSQGAHPYCVPPEHTERAREILGPDRWLCPEQKVLLETNASNARTVARKSMAIYLNLPNYLNSLKWLGFDDADVQAGGSDRLHDRILTWGDAEAIQDRIHAPHTACADHRGLQPPRPT